MADATMDPTTQHLMTGSLRFVILKMAEKQPICGVEIIEKMKKVGFDLSPGTLYPILDQLENNGLIVMEPAVVNGKRRKNYKLNKDGKKSLQAANKVMTKLVKDVA